MRDAGRRPVEAGPGFFRKGPLNRTAPRSLTRHTRCSWHFPLLLLQDLPAPLMSRDCVKLGPPAEGEVVQVKWPDGKLYGAKYLGSNVAHMYQVEFEDGSQIAMKREDIYTLDEELPKRVKARFSTASDMRFEDTFYGTDIIQGEKKRQRVLSSRFKNEYVDDPVYRTFLKSSFQKKCQKRQ